ncbi:hypothetical protein MYP_707 [Sporocytophaga myxococcoides]|uniref:Uncharacterized protein n=1 Tax=Sporocytophaga myxococcoides TaxID=153721 RepID=A0A098L9B4_9BACT|nr:hypothetical protein MYP_707 [Sporocytophaga myxococcoides]
MRKRKMKTFLNLWKCENLISIKYKKEPTDISNTRSLGKKMMVFPEIHLLLKM